MALPRPPKAVTFDCWETLLTNTDWDGVIAARVKALVKLGERERIDLSPDQARELIEGSWNRHVEEWRAGRPFGPAGASRWCLEQIGIAVNDRIAGELTDAIAGSTNKAGTRLIDGAVEAVELVRAAGIPTALICDTGFTPGRVVRRLLSEHGLALDHYFFSDEVGAPKPDRRIFEAALAATGSEAEQAVHIGDLRRTDVAGARGAGMATIRFTGSHDDGWVGPESDGEEADAVARAWPELPGLLGLD